MIEVMNRIDPARDIDVDTTSIRHKLDSRIGLEPLAVPRRSPSPRGWLAVAIGFAVVAAVFLPVLLNRPGGREEIVTASAFSELPGVESVIVDTPGQGGGLRTVAVDGSTLWVMSAVSRQLVEIDLDANEVVGMHTIEPPTGDAWIEGVVVGGGYVWLRSYAGEGEVLRFNPTIGEVDLTIPFPGLTSMAWWEERLLLSKDEETIMAFTPEGEAGEFGPGQIVLNDGDRLWIMVSAESGAVLLSSDGDRIPFEGSVFAAVEAGDHLWVIDADRKLHRLALDGSSDIEVLVGYHPIGLTEFDGSVWVTDIQDHTLTRIGSATGEVVSVTPLAGRPGAVFAAEGSLWVSMYQPGLLLRMDPAAGLQTVGEVVIDETVDGFRFFCTGGGDGPTVILDPDPFLAAGSMSVIQAELSDDALVCLHGIRETPDIQTQTGTKNENLVAALARNHISGPYLLVAAGNGVHTTRYLASDLSDVAGVVLVGPIPMGWNEWFEENLPGTLPDTVLPTPTFDGVGDFGDLPLIVIDHDRDLTFRSEEAAETFGSAENAAAIDHLWEQGIEFYAGLSSAGRIVVAEGSGGGVVWDRPQVVVDAVREILGEVG